MSAAPFRNPICVALDVDDVERALELAGSLSSVAGGFKIGPRLLFKDSNLIAKVSALAPVFVDCKFFDIPSTMVSAVQAAFDAGASLVTVHALSGAEALSELAKLENKLNNIRPFKIAAVTILTSWTQDSYPPALKDIPVDQQVRLLAELAKNAGISSLVCSSHELQLIKDLNLYSVTPGIRFSAQETQDQKRVSDPQAAIQAGASLLVVGRPIIDSANPLKSAMDYLTAAASIQ